MNILFKDEHLVAIDKPSGFHVHPHETPRFRVSRDRVCLYVLRDLLGQFVYPVHRLDAGTSGVLVFALSSDGAREMAQLFNQKTIHKTYHAVVRGWAPESGVIDLPLEQDSTGELAAAKTLFKRFSTIELPFAVGKRYPNSRYSLVEAKPITGKYHQIRRHFNRITHPLIGDSEHGDSRHNRFFREQLGIEGLCLKAQTLEFTHPWTGEALKLEAPDVEDPADKWNKIHLLFSSEPSIDADSQRA